MHLVLIDTENNIPFLDAKINIFKYEIMNPVFLIHLERLIKDVPQHWRKLNK